MSFKEWKKCKLGDVMDISSSKRIYAKEYIKEGIPFYRGKEIIEKFKGNSVSTELFISKERFTELKLKFGVPQKGDILLTSVGTLGIPYLVQDEEFYFKDGNLTWFKNFNIDCNSEFIFYWLQSDYGKNQIYSKSIGSTQKALTIDMLKKFDITIPTVEEQKAIAKILSDLDNKIEVNNKINKRLEEMAQAIFKHWFVDFEFPNEEGKPYKSSGGEMVESELGMIPNGWEVRTIGDLPVTVTDYVANGSFKSLKDNVTIYEENNYALFIRNTDLKCKFSSSKRFVDEHSYNFLSKSRLYGGEIIISNVGDVGSVYTCPLFDMPMTLGNNIIMIDTYKNEIDLNKYIFRFFKSILGQYLISGITGGSAQPKFNKTDFRNIKISIPNEKILTDYNKAIKGIENKILHNDKQNEKLSSLRDTLLPKLMSGEIRVL